MKHLQHYDLLQSEIKDKSILCIEPGNNIQNFQFSGLNIINSKLYKLEPDGDNSEYKNKYFDYIIIHGYTLDKIKEHHPNILELNLTCDVFVIDLLGEGGNVFDLLEYFNLQIVKSNKIKLLSPLKDYKGLEEKYSNVDFYKYPFAGPRVFCSKYNHMIHSDYQLTVNGISCANKIIIGKKWSDDKKDKLYTCLNNNHQHHRSILVDALVKDNLVDYGYVSNLKGDDEDIEIPVYGYDDMFRYTNHQIKIENDNILDRFTVKGKLSNTYIDVVTETSHGLMPFMTEKSVKPFYSLQLPIILGYTGIINDLREMGFDVFDDIIDHKYDTFDYSVSTDVNTKPSLYTKLNNELIIKKVNFIVEELKRLLKLDFYSIYLDLKERLIHNQNLLYKLTIEDNKLVEDYGRWIFGDNITFNKNDYIETIYI